MKNTQSIHFIVILIMLSLFICSNALAVNLNFDQYISPTDNDYTNYFNDDGAPGYYVQETTGGITGGVLVPSLYGNVAILKTPLNNSVGTTHQISMSFRYNSSLSNPFRYNTLIQFKLESGGNHGISGGIRGEGTILQLSLGSYSKASVNDDPAWLPALVDNNWYKFQFIVENVGNPFGLIEVQGSLYGLGESGLESPILIGTVSMSTYDDFFSQDSQLQLKLYSEQYGGSSTLDNFEVSIPSIAKQPPVANAGLDKTVFNSITLDGSASSDSDGTITSWAWTLTHRTNPTFNKTATSSNPTITYLSAGFYDVELIVTDNAGGTDTDTMLLGVAGTWDINGDGVIGLEEAIHALQVVSGVRSE